MRIIIIYYRIFTFLKRFEAYTHKYIRTTNACNFCNSLKIVIVTNSNFCVVFYETGFKANSGCCIVVQGQNKNSFLAILELDMTGSENRLTVGNNQPNTLKMGSQSQYLSRNLPFNISFKASDHLSCKEFILYDIVSDI